MEILSIECEGKNPSIVIKYTEHEICMIHNALARASHEENKESDSLKQQFTRLVDFFESGIFFASESSL